jgi:hypothetical protein
VREAIRDKPVAFLVYALLGFLLGLPVNTITADRSRARAAT